MRACDVVSRVAISGVCQTLGLHVRHSRTIAKWREGTHYSVSLDDSKGAWFDHVTSDSGGVLDLIQRVRGGDRREALVWLADFAGVSLDERPMTPTERQEWARRRALAEREAAAVEAWREEVFLALRCQRDEHQHLYHAGLQWILQHGLTDEHGIAVADVTDEHVAAYQRLDEHLAALRTATPADWARAWREQPGRAA
ncbi:MAG: hypothetical protein ACKV22_34355 [Bryobacteraceae bacterium]